MIQRLCCLHRISLDENDEDLDQSISKECMILLTFVVSPASAGGNVSRSVEMSIRRRFMPVTTIVDVHIISYSESKYYALLIMSTKEQVDSLIFDFTQLSTRISPDDIEILSLNPVS